MAVFSLCPHIAEGKETSSLWTLIRALIPFIPFMKAPPSSNPNHCPKAPPPIPSHGGGVELQHEFGGDTNIQSITEAHSQ